MKLSEKGVVGGAASCSKTFVDDLDHSGPTGGPRATLQSLNILMRPYFPKI